ncbi:MAG TPA: hypothetical protein GX016_10800 [Firmicutes bacterium]|nr:hypothetical protein [Bacillota bacterium]
MKTVKLALIVFIAVAIPGCLTVNQAPPADNDFVAFKNKMLALPARQESLARMALGSIMPLVAVNNRRQPYREVLPVPINDGSRAGIAFKLIKTQYGDLNQDGTVEKYLLQDGQLVIRVASVDIWVSPDDWWVDNFVLGDANNDGICDLSLSVWKAGSFGPCKPFWVEEDDRSIKNHLFIFKLVGNMVKPLWQSSNLDRPNYEIWLGDVDGDGKNELVTLEGDYTDCQHRQIGVWKWNGWGFSRLR